MGQVGTTEATKDAEPRQSFLDRPILFAKLGRITVVQHLAFIELGVALARGVAPDASDAARPRLVAEHMEEMEDWAFEILETLNADQQLEMLRTIGPKYDIDPEAVIAMTTTLPNFAELNSPIYMHTVVPNLRNLGLITNRTEDHWRRVGMIYDA